MGSGSPTEDLRESRARGEPQPTFGRDLYGFAIICLGAWILAVWILPPRLARNRRAYETEKGLQTLNSRLETKERQYEAAIGAMENDPAYRDGVYRDVLKVKKAEEEFLKDPDGVSDNDAMTAGTAGNR